MRARYVTFEGIDGSGKTKQLSMLYEYLQRQGKKVLLTREFGSPLDPTCVKIRDFALNSLHNIDEYAAQFLFAACSAQHWNNVVRPALDQYDYILSDRGVESNLAYCFALNMFTPEFAEQLYLADPRRIRPDVVVYLNTDPELAWSRVSNRTQEKFTDGGVDRVEARGHDYQIRVHQEYKKRASENKNYLIIDSTGLAVEETHKQILQKMQLELTY